MKINIIHQYYKTPEEGGAIRSYYIARHLASLGHEVRVITACNENRHTVKESRQITIYYLPVYYTNHLSFRSRLHAFYRFVVKAMGMMGELQPADLNYVITTPLSTAIIALYAKRRFGTPYFFEVGDLWPDAPIGLGILKNTWLKKLAFQLEKKSYRSAAMLIALSPEIKKAIATKAPGKMVEVITNMADTDFFECRPKKWQLEEKYQVRNKFVIAYTGTVGMANHLEYLLDAARHAEADPRLYFVVAGSGARWKAIQTEAEKRSLHNITFVGSLNKSGVREIMNVADAVFVSFKNVPVLATGSPNKFFDGLAAGKLIITNFEGWIKDLVDGHRCGFSYDPGKPGDLMDKLRVYMNNNVPLKEAQTNARLLAKQFTPEVQLEKLTRLLEGWDGA